jgi:hypothetical protein
MMARALSRRAETLRLRAALAAHLPPRVGLTVVVVERPRAEARLPNRELGLAAFRRLAIGPRQRRANQTTMHRTVVFGRRDRPRFRCGGIGRRQRLEIVGGRRFRLRHDVDVRAVNSESLDLHGRCRRGTGWDVLPSLRRHPRVLVLVIGIARRAPRLLDLVIHHRHHGVVGDAALARTVVVQDVTEPNPALLHSVALALVSGHAVRLQSRQFPPEPVPVRWDMKAAQVLRV